MAGNLAGFPFWTLHFDENGKPQADVTTFLQELPSAKLTDLLIFSHGWNNDEATAMDLYTRFFGEIRKLIDDASVPKRPNAAIGVAGVIWPSILFPGDAPATTAAGGAASFNAGDDSASLESELPKVFNSPAQQSIVQDLLAMLREQSSDPNQLLAFRDKLAALVQGTATPSTQDDPELKALTTQDDNEWMSVLNALATPSADDTSGGGAADFGGAIGNLWGGAKNAVRVTTYWTMKNRAGIVGKTGLGPLVGKIQAAAPGLNVHLLGHSFGARLVSYTLAGLPDPPAGAQSPVKSLFLLQGAFSHFAFADALPFDKSRKGDLAGMAARVDGPLLTTHSLKDAAVGTSYPLASVLARQDASDATDAQYRWEGMGHDGAQAVNATEVPLGNVKTKYDFASGKWLNLDGNQIIVNGGPPSGAHSDIVHPEIAWAALLAEKIVTAT